MMAAVRGTRPRRRSGERPIRILLVDDDAFIVEAYRCVLELAGFEVDAETKGARTLDAIDAFMPDLLLLDVNLGDTNGLDVARTVRRSHSRRALPILFLSAERDRERRAAARLAGGDGFVPKWLGHDELIGIVRMHAERRTGGDGATGGAEGW